MSKPILFYTVRTSWREEVIGVTSVSAADRRVYGVINPHRGERRTSVELGACRGRFATPDEAQAAIPQIAEIRARYVAQRKVLNDRLSELHAAQQAELDEKVGKITP